MLNWLTDEQHAFVDGLIQVLQHDQSQLRVKAYHERGRKATMYENQADGVERAIQSLLLVKQGMIRSR